MTVETKRHRDLRALDALVIPPFQPPWWLSGGHAQTLVIPALTAAPLDQAQDVTLPVEGGHLAARLDRARRDGSQSPCAALVLHGLNGSADEGFVTRTARGLTARGIDVLRLSLRGAGASRGCTPPMFHAGLTADIRAAVAWLTERYPLVGMAGFSMGGHLTLRTLVEWGDSPPVAVRAAVSVSAPLDLSATADFSDTLSATPYRVYVVAGLRGRYGAHRAVLPPALASVGMSGVHSIRAFDDRVVAPLHGFRDAADYYARASAGPGMADLRVPTLLIHAEDDPLVPVGPVRTARDAASPWVRVLITRQGGHVGFLAGHPAPGDTDSFWAEQRIVQTLAAVLPAPG